MSYKDTVFLPRTSLPVKAKPEAEVAILDSWQSGEITPSLYRQQRAARKNRTPWTLHDGPPYANGDIHVGHALNKTLKDILLRGHNLLGYDAPYVPGWDCHGLPIEWKVEEQWRRDKKDKALDPAGFRRDCRAFAKEWIEVQKEQFKRLGVLADWDAAHWPMSSGPYTTMSPEAESTILHMFHDMVRNGHVYRANKPVLWSPAERTALAEAEVTEQEHIVPNIWVRFPVHSGPLFFEGANLLVWTTTPWSLPGNAAVAFNSEIAYGLYETPSGRYVVADSLAEQVFSSEGYARLRDIDPFKDLDGHTLFHPLGNGYKSVTAIPARFVRESAGTGFVHVGPAHSTEDWIAWRDEMGDAPFPNPIGENGVYNDDVRVFAGIAVTKGKKLGPANDAVIDHLFANGMLYRREDRPLTMQHSWRSDAVLITRAAPQVFIGMDKLAPSNGMVQGSTTVLDRAVNALDDVAFTPTHAKARMLGMLQNRPDWLVSRQRFWGTPLALFVHKETGTICDDPNVLAVTHQTLADAGTEEWFDLTPENVFPYAQRDDADQWERLDDVLDVWFDSGCVHYMMTNAVGGVADLVVEGTDQSRGWFQSSLLVSVLSGRGAPYRQVLTHGFTVDPAGKKMSKSQGNVLDPHKVIEKYGADALRVWVASTDTTEDVRISMASMDAYAEIARKVRNTMRYMVGALHDYDPAVENGGHLPELERFVLHRVQEVNDRLAGLLQSNNLTGYMAVISNFCVHDLSTLWFDIRKDSLYCDAPDALRRRAYRWTLAQVFDHMVRWIAPVMVFAADELWMARYPDTGSVHLQEWLHPVDWRDDALAEKWQRLIGYRSVMLGEIEKVRVAGEIKSATEVNMLVVAKSGSQVLSDLFTLSIPELAELAIVGEAMLVSLATIEGDMQVTVTKSESDKCDRCWLTKPDVHECDTGKLCDRCCEVVV